MVPSFQIRKSETCARSSRSSIISPLLITQKVMDRLKLQIRRSIKILKKTISAGDWAEKLPEGGLSYVHKNSYCGAIPFSLVYGTEAVLPYEVQVPSLRVAIDDELTHQEKRESLLAQLELLDEKRLHAADHARAYQLRLSRAYQKKGGRRSGVVVGDFVFRKIMPAKSLDPKGKFRPNWEGPYAISAVYPGNAYLLPLDSLRDFARWVRFSLE